MRKDAPLAVDVPGPDRDSPGWVKVGVIAAVGFVIGVAWPRVMGVKLGPSAPGESSASASASGKGAGRAPDAPPATVATSLASAGHASSAAPPAASSPPPPATHVAAGASAPQITVQKGNVLSCKTEGGDTKKGKECGAAPGLDLLVAPRVRKIAGTCPAAEGQTGKLSLVVTADFAGQRLNWDIGKSSTVGNVEGISACLKSQFQGVSTAGVAHEHARYTVAYVATFAPGAGEGAREKLDIAKKGDAEPASEKGAKEDRGDKPEAPAPTPGEATIGWDVALVRDIPKTGGVVARLPRGTKVKIGPAKDGWYSIKYGDAFGSEGWVHRGALGR